MGRRARNQLNPCKLSSDLFRRAFLPTGFVHGAIRRTMGILVLGSKKFPSSAINFELCGL
jgi:hypothetical protein